MEITRPGQPGPVPQDVMTMSRYAGTDAHNADLHVPILSEDGEEVGHSFVGNEAVAFGKLTDRLNPDDHDGNETGT